ncbi:HAMP domain-containing protein [Actinoplanes sp. NPDC049596]|uniref:HAMP domain-containing protein n=1 Tax=unclassified Actinoplanes TaxID=2626549 RepID=UPI0034336770
MRLRTQLTFAVTAVVALVVALAGLFVLLRIDSRDQGVLDRELSSRADRIRVTASKSGTLSTDGTFAARLVKDGEEVKQVGSSAGFPLPVANGYSTVEAGDAQWRSFGETLSNGSQLQILMTQEHLNDQHGSNVRTVVLLVVLAALLSAAGVWFATGYMLRPFQRLLTSARDLDPADPSQRLPEVRSPREVAELASTLNGLLDRARGARQVETRPAVSAETVEIPKIVVKEVVTETVEKVVKVEGPDLRPPLADLGANLEALLDNPDMPATQRHLLLAAMADEHRRMIDLLAQESRS